jgi:hypothetical protein
MQDEEDAADEEEKLCIMDALLRLRAKINAHLGEEVLD